MKKTLACCLMLLAGPASAQYTLRFIPAWTMQEGRACYGFDDATRLVEVDSRLGTLLDNELHYLRQLRELDEATDDLRQASRLAQDEALLWQTRSEALEASLREKIVENLELQGRLNSNLPWFIGAGAVLVIGGVLLGVAAASTSAASK